MEIPKGVKTLLKERFTNDADDNSCWRCGSEHRLQDCTANAETGWRGGTIINEIKKANGVDGESTVDGLEEVRQQLEQLYLKRKDEVTKQMQQEQKATKAQQQNQQPSNQGGRQRRRRGKGGGATNATPTANAPTIPDPSTVSSSTAATIFPIDGSSYVAKSSASATTAPKPSVAAGASADAESRTVESKTATGRAPVAVATQAINAGSSTGVGPHSGTQSASAVSHAQSDQRIGADRRKPVESGTVGAIEKSSYPVKALAWPTLQEGYYDPPRGDYVKAKQSEDSGNDFTAIGKGKRKAKATENEPVKIISNYVRVLEVPKVLYVHSLKFWRPNPKNGNEMTYNKRREIESAFRAATDANHSESLKLTGKIWATDWKDLWCNEELEAKDYGPLPWAPPGQAPISDLYLRLGKPTTMNDFKGAFETKAADDLLEESRALNAIIARSVQQSASNPATQIGPNKFFLNGGFRDIQRGLQVQRGYFSSIRPSQIGPLLNVNTANTAFLPHTGLLVSDFVSMCGSVAYAEKLLAGAMVRIIYRRQNYEGGADMNREENRVKQFQQFGFEVGYQRFYPLEESKKGDSKKKVKSGDNGTTVYEYCEKILGRESLPAQDVLCVNVGKRKVKSYREPRARPTNPSAEEAVKIRVMQTQSEQGAIWIPATLLQICPFQQTKGSLDPDHTSSMITLACRRPLQNLSLINREGLEQLGITGMQEPLHKMGVTTARSLISFDAERLPTPRVLSVTKIEHASWNLDRVKFSQPRDIHQLRILATNGSLNPHQLVNFYNAVAVILDNAGRPGVLGIGRQSKAAYYKAANQLGAAAGHTGTNIRQFMEAGMQQSLRNDCTIVVLRTTNEIDYAQIKRLADLRMGRHVVCVQAAKVRNPDHRSFSQYISNVLMKVNMRMGGFSHEVDVPDLERFKNKLIILGADVTHPGVSSCVGYPSIASVVGSVDSRFMTYPGSMRLQAGRQEEIAAMEGMVRERLLAWRKFNGGNLPEYMLFYRDGISESQFKRCRQAEITAIKKAYLSCAKNAQSPPQLKLTFIVVGKRHNTRFYPQDKGAIVVPRKNPNDTRNTNLKPGLYVANTITDPGHFNFYLQSHNAIQGTARSAHYHVLEHELPLKNEQLATVTHAMCYCFGRATKGVSYAAPAYIADRLCERGRVYLRSWDPSHSDFESFHTAQRAPGTPCKGAAEILQWKQTKALELSRNRQHGIWGHYDEATGRYNPWHPDIDDIMFWM